MCLQGMRVIETLEPLAFNDYLKKTSNTICGRYPICVMLQVWLAPVLSSKLETHKREYALEVVYGPQFSGPALSEKKFGKPCLASSGKIFDKPGPASRQAQQVRNFVVGYGWKWALPGLGNHIY